MFASETDAQIITVTHLVIATLVYEGALTV